MMSEHKDKKKQGEALDERLEELEDRIGALETERADYEGKYKRALADYQNFQRRSVSNEQSARREGAASVLHSMITALDHFDQALAQDPEKMSAQQLVEGVRLIKSELLNAIRQHGASVIEPKAGDEFDPNRHEALSRIPAAGVEPGCIAEVYQVGYAHDERVLRPAKVIVAAPSEDDDGGKE